MKAKKVFLNELTDRSTNYKVKVKIIGKDRTQLGQTRKIPYQGLLLEDEKGNKMRGALFGPQVQSYKDALVYNGTYEISQATIKPMEDKWKKSPAELNYQMGFTSNTIIQPMDIETGPVLPDYVPIGQIPRNGDPMEKIDVLGVVLFVEEKPRTTTIGNNRTIDVAEVVLMDHSTQQPLTISTWDDLATLASETLLVKAEHLEPVGFTALKVSTHKGFSMSTTKSTEIIHSPEGEKVAALEKWAADSAQILFDKRSRILHAKKHPDERKLITIAALHAKRAQHTLQDDRYWLRVQIPETEFTSLIAYLGCSKCGRSSKLPAETKYTCSLCHKTDCISIPRATFSCNLTDGTGTLNITAFTAHCEQLFKLPAQDIFRIKHSDDVRAFEVAKQLMRATTYLVEVGPKTNLSMSNILEWVPKQIVVEEIDNSNSPVNPSNPQTIEQRMSSPTMQSSIFTDTDTSISQKMNPEQNTDNDPKDNPAPIIAKLPGIAFNDAVQLVRKAQGEDVAELAKGNKKVEIEPTSAENLNN